MQQRFRKPWLYLLTLVLLAPVLVDSADARRGAAGRRYVAELSGANEVPNPVQTDATGRARVQFNRRQTRVMVDLRVRDIADITGAHLHLAAEGQNGPVVLTLFNSQEAEEPFTRRLRVRLEEADLEGPLAGQTFADLIEQIDDGNVYVNIHTAANRPGEIRGQLVRKGRGGRGGRGGGNGLY